MSRSIRIGWASALDAAGGHTLDDVVLAEDVDQDGGDDCHGSACQDTAVADDITGDQEGNTDLNGTPFGGIGDQQGPEELVVNLNEQVNSQRGDGGNGQRNGDLEQKAHIAAAVDGGRFLEISRQGQEILTHQEDGRTGDQRRQHQTQIAVDESQLLYGYVVCDNHNLAGDHHGAEDQGEQEILAGELEEHEAVGCQSGNDDLCHDTDAAHDEGILQVGQQRHLLEHGDVVLQGGVLGNQNQGIHTQLVIGLNGEQNTDDQRGDKCNTNQCFDNPGSSGSGLFLQASSVHH